MNTPRLYHGTPVAFSKRTRKVHPSPYDGEAGGYPKGFRIAHATSSLDEAKMYGAFVYEVMFDEHTQHGYGETAYISEKGFTIIGRVL